MSTKPIVVIADKLSDSTIAALGDEVDIVTVDGTDRTALLAAVVDAAAIMVRSATTVDAEVIDHAPQVKIIARAGVGVDNIDLAAATKRGILVVNAPTSNIHSAAEHTVALLLATARQIPAADASLKAHTWKRNNFLGTELLGKTLGVIGLGRIGQLVARRLAAFEMNIIAYDPYASASAAAQIGARLVDLDTVLKDSDAITIHLPKTPETLGLIGKRELGLVKRDAIIINAARGGLVDEQALAHALAQGTIKGAGFDVFTVEPATDNPLFDNPHAVVTPHIAASTKEAQDRAGVDVARSVVQALRGQFVADAVNISSSHVDELVSPWIDLTRKLGMMLAALSRNDCAHSALTSITVTISGELSAYNVDIIPLAALCGILQHSSDEQVTFVNVSDIARTRGITINAVTQSHSPAYRSVIDIAGVTEDGAVINISGALTGVDLVHKIVNLNGRNFDLRAQGHNLILSYTDRPGILGLVGSALGDAGIDIHAAGLSPDAQGSGATMILRLDRYAPDDVINKISSDIGATTVVQVDLL